MLRDRPPIAQHTYTMLSQNPESSERRNVMLPLFFADPTFTLNVNCYVIRAVKDNQLPMVMHTLPRPNQCVRSSPVRTAAAVYLAT